MYIHIYEVNVLKTTTTVRVLTSGSSVCSLDSPVLQRAVSVPSPPAHWRSDLTLSDGRDWTSGLRPRLHSESLKFHSHKVCDKTNCKRHYHGRRYYIFIFAFAFNIKTVEQILFNQGTHQRKAFWEQQPIWGLSSVASWYLDQEAFWVEMSRLLIIQGTSFNLTAALKESPATPHRKIIATTCICNIIHSVRACDHRWE